MPKAPESFRVAPRRVLSAVSYVFVLGGYALAGFGAVLILDGGVRVVSMLLNQGVLVAPREVSIDFVTALSLVVAGVVVFVAGRLFAAAASSA